MRKRLISSLLAFYLSGCQVSGCSDNLIEEPITEPVYSQITIASFNIQQFGESKRGKEDVMSILERIVRNYDIVAVQEVQDKSGATIPYFVDRINQAVGDEYSFVISQRLGRTSQKEQYAFVYNTRTITYTGTSFVYNDTGDIFEREPYIAGFRAGNFDFALVNIHTKPEDAEKEIFALSDVVGEALREFPDDNDVIILGDFNADCTYFNEAADRTPLESDRFYWVIPDKADTTTRATTDCTYDRIVFLRRFTLEDYANEWDVFEFDKEYGLDTAFAVKVSDHYPVSAVFHTTKDTD